MRAYFRRADPFYDEQENHSLIGVANVFLECLFYDVKLQYAVPIINQKGEVCYSLSSVLTQCLITACGILCQDGVDNFQFHVHKFSANDVELCKSHNTFLGFSDSSESQHSDCERRKLPAPS